MTDSISNDLAAHALQTIRAGGWDRHLGSLQLAIEERVCAIVHGDPTSPTGWPRSWTPEAVEAVEALHRTVGPHRRFAEADAVEWPDGHPCRDCGRLAKDHSDGSTFDLTCDGWR